jgi:hypothetical protein
LYVAKILVFARLGPLLAEVCVGTVHPLTPNRRAS